MDLQGEVDARCDDFLEQFRLWPEASAIVVGHSLFWRNLFLRHSSEAFRNTELGTKLSTRKLQNCGVVACHFDFHQATPVNGEPQGGSGMLGGATLMFDSQVM